MDITLLWRVIQENMCIYSFSHKPKVDVTKNILHCLAHGTEMGWLIDPDEQTVFIYYSDQKIVVLDQPGALLPVPAFAQALQLKVQDIFAWLLE